MKETTKCYCGHTTTCDCGPEQYFKDIEFPQQERSYSEEDMQEYAEFCIRCNQKELPCIIAKDWFEQFKKK
jgi:hypothetical protein